MSAAYDAAFYDAHQRGSALSAGIVVPLVLERFPVRSVIDVGCGAGQWLGAFMASGVTDVTGLDGDYVDRAKLAFPADRFFATDLAGDFPLTRRYDLACSLEVAEHLPADAGPGFVAKLCAAAPLVLFSAAIPHQGGTEHVNELWQDDWRRAFAAHGYRPLDLVRWRVWGNPAVEFWYQQNTVLYADAATLAARPDLTPVAVTTSLNVVHPDAYTPKAEAAEMYLSKALKRLPQLFRDAARRRLGA